MEHSHCSLCLISGQFILLVAVISYVILQAISVGWWKLEVVGLPHCVV
jgi:hypothetical protein